MTPAGRNKWIAIAGAVVVVSAVVAFSTRREAKPQYLASKVLRGDIHDAVDATGTVSAVITVQVGSQVSGRIAKLNADFNSRVHRGDIVAEIDPTLLQATLQQAQADLADARANVTAAQANESKAIAVLVQTKADFDRTSALAKTRAESEQVLELARANYESARAAVDAARANVEQAKAQVSQKTAAVSMARTNLDYTVIRSPIDGIVVARNVDIGQTVAASLQAPTIFTIAQDLTKMLVYAKVDESDVGRIRLGQPVVFKVDAFPKDQFRGTIRQVRMNPTTVQNVVTYDAVVEFSNPDLKLFPGMTAYVNIPVASVANVLKVPNAALRFRPPVDAQALRALYARAGIDPDIVLAGEEQSAVTAPAKGARAPEIAVVWKLDANHDVIPVAVTLGITDHAYTEVRSVVKGRLDAGDDLVTTAVAAKASGPGAPGAPARR